jgi:hypothetical protein
MSVETAQTANAAIIQAASLAVRGASPASHRDRRPASAKATAVRRSVREGGCARRTRGAEGEHRLYLTEAQRSRPGRSPQRVSFNAPGPPGCDARRMQRALHHGLLGFVMATGSALCHARSRSDRDPARLRSVVDAVVRPDHPSRASSECSPPRARRAHERAPALRCGSLPAARSRCLGIP